MSAENKLGTQPVKKLLFQLAVPAIVAQVVNVLYNVVDRMYIGHIPDVGALSLTGVGVCMPIIMVISAFSSLIGMGGAPRASILLGQDKVEDAKKVLGNSAFLLVCISITLTIFFTLFAEKLLLSFGASENTIGYAMEYMRIYALGTIFVQFVLGLNPFITAQGFAKISMQTILIGAITNIILDPIFIFVLGMGVSGAALATILSQSIGAIWVLLFLTGKRTTLRLERKFMKLEVAVFAPCLLLGLSPFVMQLTESMINIAFNSSLLKYGGDIAVGSMTICTSLMQFVMLPLIGLSQGAQPITGYNFGAKNPERVKETFQLLLKCAVTFSVSAWLLLMLAPQVLVSLFSSDAELVEFAIWAVRRYMLMCLVFGVQLSCQQTFIAIGNAKTSLFLAILRKVILLVPLIYILPMFLENQMQAVFLAEPVADLLAVIATATMFRKQFKEALQNLELGVRN
ncbi:MATE family efflux transporter [Chakrabartyella piscis]|uniref:MATE family efflux transporter n=1 Tax=Chakrabartyella piscis TaxID=2918914 RepID=UPI002958D4CC|nr:MATE family efflux transporter [Chakrabartyella piscis]